MRTRRHGLALLAACALAPGVARGFGGGTSGMSGKPPASSCTGCHTADGTALPAIALDDAPPIPAGETAHLKLVFSSLAQGAGFDVAVSDGTLSVKDGTPGVQLRDGEVTHARPWPKGTQVSVELDLLAPAAPGTVTLFVTALSGNDDKGAGGDSTASRTFELTIGAPPDLGGVDLAGVDLARPVVVDLATPRFASDEPRWALSCSMGRRTDTNGASIPLALLVLVAAIRLGRRPRA